MSKPAVVVVGGGLAGTVLGRTLQNRGWQLELFHHPQPGAATPVAAGLWNPINFFRLIPGWRVEESLASMLEFFEAEEQAFGQTFLHPMPYGQPLFNADHLFQWEGAVQRFPRWLELQRDSLPGLENLERLWGGVKAWGLVREAGVVGCNGLYSCLSPPVGIPRPFEPNLVETQLDCSRYSVGGRSWCFCTF